MKLDWNGYKFDWNNSELPDKLIIGSTLIALLSLFTPWVNMGIVSLNGFQQQGYILIPLFIYPVLKILKSEKMSFIPALACGAIMVLITIYFISTKSINVYGESINVSGWGLWLFLLTSIGFTLGIYLEEKGGFKE
tara:strand:+ start:336 stop:743 length:408 start_codon:yes stop_codon:yes gene_type:complete